jgi:hypothetical protein
MTILRTWTFWIHTPLREECRLHLEATKLAQMRAACGNRRAAALFRDCGDGTTVVTVMSIWDSMDSIRAFAGREVQQPSIDAQDRGKLFDREPVVRHYPLSHADALLPLPAEWREAGGA